MRAQLRILAFAILALSVSFAALGQQNPPKDCDDEESLQNCFNQFVDALPAIQAQANTQAAAVTQKSMADAADRVAKANTGVSSLVSPASSAVKDFLSVLSASLESSSLTSNGQTLTFDYNLASPILDQADQIKLQVVLTKPTISDDLKTRLGTNNDAIAGLNDELSNIDDLTGSATYNPVSQRYGRSIAPHRRLFESMLLAAVSKAAPTLAESNRKFRAILRQFNIQDPNQTFAEIVPNDMAQRALLKQAVADAFTVQGAANQAFTTFATRFARLLNNQPQRYASVVYRDRNDLVGPNEWTAKATYEFGAQNLNKFLDSDGRGCDDPRLATDAAADCFDRFNTYVTRTGVDKRGASDRFTLSAEYHGLSSTHVDLPAYSIAYDTKGGHSLVYELTYGRSFDPNMGRREGRLDVKLNYEDSNEEGTTLKRDRFVGSITYTLKLSDTISVPVALIYANHEQYLSTIDRKLNAHFGLVYKLPNLTQ